MRVACSATVMALWASLAVAAEPITWSTTAAQLGLLTRYGKHMRVVCPAGAPSSYRIRGTDDYTSDSPVCPAAVHAGAMGWGGGEVEIVMALDRGGYLGSQRNGVASMNYGAFNRSYHFQFANEAGERSPGSGSAAAGRDTLTLCRTVSAERMGLRGRLGERISFYCPPSGPVQSAGWGSGRYTDDSPICPAAVHAGVISCNGGGGALVMAPDEGLYTGSQRNGVSTQNYGPWKGSFYFLESNVQP